MKNKNIIIGILLFIAGFVGILSLLTMDIPIPEDARNTLPPSLSDAQIKILLLINPFILLILSVFAGTILYERTGLKLPVIEKLLIKTSDSYNIYDILKFGAFAGILAGILISGTGYLYSGYLPDEFVELGKTIKPTLAARFLYGGITEEILVRFGLMTFLVWIFIKISKQTSSIEYWIGILLSSFVFAIGHFPAAFQAVESPSLLMLSFILTGNGIGGIIFGYMYWKKGLEAAMTAHIFAHGIMLAAEYILN